MAKRNILLTGSASMLALLAAGVHAQDAPPSTDAAPAGTVKVTPADSDTQDTNEIVVTGIRGSIRQSIESKRRSDLVVDVISAEDIGKFPDKNVAEALQRVPGVTINREYGEGERVSVRGTNYNLTKTLVNGHNIATADWFILDQQNATRSFNYLTLPADLVGQLEVYKSPEADIEEGGIGATINVHTRNPLDLKPFTISGSAQAVYSERSKKTDPQATGLVSWHNADSTFGVLLAGVYEKRRIRRDGYEVLGYFTPDNPAVSTAQLPSLIGSALFRQNRERYGGNVGVQFKPSDTLEVNVTGLYSRFNANSFNQNYMAWGSNAIGGGGMLTDATIVDDTAVKGTITSTPTGRAVVYDAIDRKAYAETWYGDVDVKWSPSEGNTVHAKAGYTHADGDTSSQPFYEGGAPGSFTYDLTGKSPVVKFTGVDPTKPGDLALDFASYHSIGNRDKEKYAYLDFEHDLDLGPLKSFKLGGKYTDHDRNATFLATTYGSFFIPLSTIGCDGGPCTSDDFADGLIPSSFGKNIAADGALTSYFNVSTSKLESIIKSLPAAARERIINPPENYAINEKTYGGYAMVKFGGDNWHGNAGVRVVRTEQLSSGNIVGTTGPGSISNAFGTYSPISVKKNYTDVLPSANVVVDLDPTLVLRFAAARTMTRPDYTDIVPRVSLNPGSLSGNGGDPGVKPYRADQFDASLEFYPDRDTIFAVALFYKDLQSYIVNTTDQEVFPVETTTPNLARCTSAGTSNVNLYNCRFDINRRSNGPGGRTQGIEIQANRKIYGGFGALVNYTYADAKSNNDDPIPGYSKHSLNVSGFYEDERLSARLSYNYRSNFFIDIDRASPLNQKATDSLDASFSFAISPNVAITADAVNLTNEKVEQYSGTTARVRAIYDNGRIFYAGLRFRM